MAAHKRFPADFPPALVAAVNAYDAARRARNGANEPHMSDANKTSIAPLIEQACQAFCQELWKR